MYAPFVRIFLVDDCSWYSALFFPQEGNEEEIEDGGLECVICMSDMRDTLILPCRHLCLCQACADSLRYQANNCPICRSPFRALLQIKAMHKISESLASISEVSCKNSGVSIVRRRIDVGNGLFNCLRAQMNEGIPPGYERVSLIEALNGPVFTKKYATLESSTLEPLLDSTSTASVIHPSVTTTTTITTTSTTTTAAANRNKWTNDIENYWLKRAILYIIFPLYPTFLQLMCIALCTRSWR